MRSNDTSKPTTKSLTTIVVTWNSGEDIAECLTSLRSSADFNDIAVGDNGSFDGTPEIIREKFPDVTISEFPENPGFAAACNRLASSCATEFVLFLNPDCIVNPSALESALERFAGDTGLGLVSVALDDERGVRQRICYRFPGVWNSIVDGLGLYRLLPKRRREESMLGDFFDNASSRDVDWVYGAFMLVRRRALAEIGGVPEDYFLFAEDLDLCYQLRAAGYRIGFIADVSVIHKGNRSAGQLPGTWRIERTVLTRYAFCFKNFGLVRTRLIQMIDLTGLVASVIRAADSDSRGIAMSYLRVTARSLMMGRRTLSETIHTRPDAAQFETTGQ